VRKGGRNDRQVRRTLSVSAIQRREGEGEVRRTRRSQVVGGRTERVDRARRDPSMETWAKRGETRSWGGSECETTPSKRKWKQRLRQESIGGREGEAWQR
jgi:hypothetical protein